MSAVREGQIKTLIKDLEHVVTFDDEDRELEGADILIDGPAISAVGWDLPSDGVDTVIDGRGLIALPGLINSHNHLWEAGLRCFPEIERARLVKWRTAMGRCALSAWEEGDFRPETIGPIAKAVLLESLLGGTTTIADHYYHFPGGGDSAPFIEATVEAAREVGIRLQICRGSMTLGVSDGSAVPDVLIQSIDEVIRHSSQIIDMFHDPEPFAWTRVALSPCGLHTDHPDVFDATSALAFDHPGVTLHTHLYCEADSQLSEQLWGQTPWEIISKRGWANDRVWIAHVVDPPAAEINEFAATGVKVSHCPLCDSRMGYGFAPIRAYLDAGVTVGLSSSGSGSNDDSNLLAQLRFGAVAHRNTMPDEDQWPSMRQWFRMATRGSALCMGRDDLGVLSPGYAADISCWRMTGVDRVGVHDLLPAIVMTGLSTAADLVIVNGEAVVQDGRSTRVDDHAVARDAKFFYPRTRHPNLTRKPGTTGD